MKVLIASLLSLSLLFIMLPPDNQPVIMGAPECDTIIGNTAIDTCILSDLDPIVQVGDTVSKCFNFVYTGPFNVGYLSVVGICGPVAQYDYLDFRLYNNVCDTLIASGELFPNNSSASWVYYLNIGQTYTICYTWVAQCEQEQVCPQLHSSLLPVELMSFNGVMYDECAKLGWTVGSELYVAGYLVHASYDNRQTFEYVGYQASLGNTSVPRSYSLFDCRNDNQGAYYQLIEVDIDGAWYTLKEIYLPPATKPLRSNKKIYTPLGVEVSDFQPGLNIVKEGDTVYKVIMVE